MRIYALTVLSVLFFPALAFSQISHEKNILSSVLFFYSDVVFGQLVLFRQISDVMSELS